MEPDALESEELWGEQALKARLPRYTVSELMDYLVQNAQPLNGRDLFALSDLSRRDAEIVRTGWLLIPLERRRAVVQYLIEMAAEELDLHLGRILRVALRDSDAAVRRLAIQGLWEETESDLLGPLIEAMKHDEDNNVRMSAAATLGNYILAGELDEIDASLTMRAEQALLEVLHSDHEPVALRAHALESLAYSGETGVRQLIEDAYYSPDEELRVSALIAMGRSADVHWRNYVRAELQSPSTAMRAAAAEACGELEVNSARQALLELLLDPEQPVRLATITALGRIGGREAQEALRTIANEGEAVEAQAAEDALDEMAFYADNRIALYDDDEEDEREDDDLRDGIDDGDDLGEYAR
jgi:HEAT repeat protein